MYLLSKIDPEYNKYYCYKVILKRILSFDSLIQLKRFHRCVRLFTRMICV